MSLPVGSQESFPAWVTPRRTPARRGARSPEAAGAPVFRVRGGPAARIAGAAAALATLALVWTLLLVAVAAPAARLLP